MSKPLSSSVVFNALENRVDDLEAVVATPVVNNVTNNNTFTVTGGNMAAASGFADAAAIATHFGSNDLPVLLDSIVSITANPQVFPANAKFILGGGKFVKSGSGKIQFAGDPGFSGDEQRAAFSGFANGDVTFTGTVWPRRVSTELVDTGTSSLTDRLAFLNSAFGTKQTCFVCYPRTITNRITFNPNKEIYFTPGDYPNTLPAYTSGPVTYAFNLDDNTTFHGTHAARIFESTTAIYGVAIVGNSDFYATKENVVVKNLTFMGDPAQTPSSGLACVQLMNVHRGGIRNCVFNGVHGYAAVLGSYGSTGNYAYESDISDNKFFECSQQVIAFINTINCRIQRNDIFMKDCPWSGTVIDCEPNNEDDVMNGVVLEDNFISFEKVGAGTVLFGGIVVQATATSGIKTAVLKNNTILGRPISTDISYLGQLTVGITVNGVEDLTFEGNCVRSAYQGGFGIINCRYVKGSNNKMLGCVSEGLRLTSVADSTIDNTDIRETYTPYTQISTIQESETKYVATGVGSTITRTDIYDLGLRFFDHMYGLNVFFNGAVHSITGVNHADQSFAVTPALNVPLGRTAAAADINVTTNKIGITAHGFVNNQVLYYYNHEPTGLTSPGYYYVVNATTNDFQLAATSGGTPIDLTQQGYGHPQSFIPTITSVDTSADTITYNGHGFLDTAIVRYAAGTGAIGGLTDGNYYYIVNKTANTFQLALTAGGSPINLTSAGTGFQTFIPVMETRFSNNIYRDNYAPDGHILAATGTSQIASTSHDGVITEVADAAHTATTGEGVIVYTSLTAGRTVNLPDATTCRGKEIVVKDYAGSAGTNNITLDGFGSQTIDGSATKAINSNYGALKVKSNGANWFTLTSSVSAGSGPIGGTTGGTDNAILRADGTGGSTVQGSAATMDDTGNISAPSFIANATAAVAFEVYPGYFMGVGSGALLFRVGAGGIYQFQDSGSADMVKFDKAGAAAGQTCLMLWDVDNGTLERVTVGAADSGGTGFKVLRIPN
jgi:hypothetical protein